MKNIILLSVTFLSGLLHAQTYDTRNDSIDVSKYILNMDMRNMSQKKIIGECSIEFSIKQFQVDTLRLDLLGLAVDSILDQKTQSALPYRYNGKNIYIALDASFKTNSSNNIIRIKYNGSPIMDASGWGGFYFTPPYAYNLGVGFAADPHCYGRAWFPCMDNFTDKAIFEYYFTVPKGNAATCADCLPNNYIVNADSSRTYFDSAGNNEYYPTYLASIAVAPFQFVTWTHHSHGQDIPVVLAAEAKDTSYMRLSFSNLDKWIAGLIESYGPFQFSKVGYSLVPFNSGAMEHVGNIAYPQYAANGTLQQEHLYAHELSHHWWGDNITCHSQEDMWLNEGWASYSEALFSEYIYGKKEYKLYVASNHLNVLHYTHIIDSGYRAVSGVPHDYTYGRTVYLKGADMVHTLRGYMGDSAFFAACKGFQNQYKFKDVSSLDMQVFFQKYTSRNLEQFFRNYIFNPGFPHFESRLLNTMATGNTWKVNWAVLHTPMGKSPVHDSEWFEVTFFGKNKEEFSVSDIWHSDNYIYTTQNIPFEPVYLLFDRHELKSDAISDDVVYINPNTQNTLAYGMMNITAGSFTDSAFVVVQHHWIGPTGTVTPKGAYLSPNRYWTVGGIWPADFTPSASILYNGQLNTNGGYLDDKLIRITEDSLVLMYRADFSKPWDIYTDYTKNMGSKTDKKGNIKIAKLKQGEYALAMYDSKLSTEDPKNLSSVSKFGLTVIPNPGREQIYIQFDSPMKEDGILKAYDSIGREVGSINVFKNSTGVNINLSKAGTYILSLYGNSGQQLGTCKAIIQ